MKSPFSRFAKTLISLQKSARTLKSDAIEGSPVYLRSMLRRPPAVLPWKLPGNSRSFIGTVIRPVKGYGSNNPIERAYTLFEVKTPSRDSDLPPPPFKTCKKYHLIMRKRRDRLRLWQVFFASTHEWWDNRQNKLNPLMPDFKRKDTQECLWLRPDDPPWVRKQLQHYDSSTRGA